MTENENVQRSLGRIEGKLDSLIFSVNSHVTEDAKQFAIHEKKIDDIKGDVLTIKTKATILGSVAAIIISTAIQVWKLLNQ